MTNKSASSESMKNFQEMIPRSIYAEAGQDRLDKTASIFTGAQGGSTGMGGGGAGDVLRNPSRRFYHPEYTMSAMYMPRERTQVNRWCRWYYDHDEMIGAVLDMHAELPYSSFEIEEEDPYIKRAFEDCIDHTNLFSKLSSIDLEFLKIGEVFIYTPWNAKKGMWDSIFVQNPDFIETTYSPFADHESVIELKPDPELRALIHSTKPEEQALKRKLPNEILRRVLSGKNIILPNEEVTHIARRSNPYDMRGTSILRRLFRCYVPETKVRMFDGTCKEIKDVVKGDFVLSLHGEKREVLDTVQYEIDDNIVEIKPEKSWETLKSTMGHEYLVQKSYCACGCGTELTYRQLKNGSNFIHGHNLKFNSNRIEGGYKVEISSPIFKTEKLAAEKIKPGDRLLVPINNEVKECTLTEGQGRLLGYFMAEGCFSNEQSKQPCIEFTFGRHEIDTWVADTVSILENDFGISPNIYPGYHGKNVCAIKIVRKEHYEKLASFFNDNMCGRRSWTKEFTEKVLYYPKNIQKQILIGAFRGDASRNKNYSEVIYNTTSKKLAEQMQWILFRCSYFNYIKPWDPKPKMICSNTHVSILKRFYWVRVTGQDSKNFIKDCWDDYKELTIKNSEIYDIIKDMRDNDYTYTRIAKELNLMGLKGVEGGSFFSNIVKGIYENKGSVHKSYQFTRDKIIKDDNYFYVPVKSTKITKYKGVVHDITVDTNHWWLAQDGYTTSNTMMYEDKLREAQITIADGFIYPLKIFKLGDSQKGWIPNVDHQRALASMLQQAAFDPNFALIYHYALSVEYVTTADKVMRLDPEWNEINKRKAYALGVSEEFMSGGSTYSSANVGLQVQLARYKAKRDLFEQQWLRDKFFKVMSEKNGWYRRDKKELVGQYRVTRSAKEKQERLVVPSIVWQKKLMFRDDQGYLTFLNQVYQNGKGPISAITLLQSMGLDIEDELRKKGRTSRLEKVHGTNMHPPVGGAGGLAGITASNKDSKKEGFWNKKSKKTAAAEDIEPKLIVSDEEFTKTTETDFVAANAEPIIKLDVEEHMFEPVDDNIWYSNLESPNIPVEVLVLLTGYKAKLDTVPKKYPGNIPEGYSLEKDAILKFLVDLYMQGKMTAYSWTDFLPIYKEIYAIDDQLRDYSDIIMSEEMNRWVSDVANSPREDVAKNKILRNIGNTAFAHGQLKGFQEQGIFNVKISNVKSNDGLRYKMNELLSKGNRLAADISPKDEIIVFAPCIEGFDDALENNVDPHIKRHKDFYCKGITVKACPVEYIPYMKRYLEKVGSFLKNVNIISFVEDVSETPEWENTLKTKLEKTYSDESKEIRPTLIARDIMVEKMHKKAKITHFTKGKTLYVSSWIGMEDRSIIDSLVDYIDIFDSNAISTVKKAFKTANYDLTEQELHTYSIFNYIEPLSGDVNNPRGYKMSSMEESTIPLKIIKGKVWDTTGKCLYASKIESVDVFRDNLKLWIEYPQLLDNDIKSAFKSLE